MGIPGNSKLIQARGTTSLATVFSPAAGARGRIASIIVANTSGGDATFRICIDEDGTTYDESTAIAWDVSCNAGQVIQFDYGTYETGALPINVTASGTAGNVAVQSSVNNAHTFTFVGVVFV